MSLGYNSYIPNSNDVASIHLVLLINLRCVWFVPYTPDQNIFLRVHRYVTYKLLPLIIYFDQNFHVHDVSYIASILVHYIWLLYKVGWRLLFWSEVTSSVSRELKVSEVVFQGNYFDVRLSEKCIYYMFNRYCIICIKSLTFCFSLQLIMDVRTIKQENLTFPIKATKYWIGVDGYMSYANNNLTVDGRLRCLCVKCVNYKLLKPDNVN